MRIYPIHKAFITGALTTALIMGTGLYFYRAGIQAGSITIKAETPLSFRCPPGTKISQWQMVYDGDYRGELLKRCLK